MHERVIVGDRIAFTAIALAGCGVLCRHCGRAASCLHAPPAHRHRSPLRICRAGGNPGHSRCRRRAIFSYARRLCAGYAELTQYVGLSREQAVDKVLASARTDAVTPCPTGWTNRSRHATIRKAWTVEQRRDEQRLRGQRYELLRAWWVREMLATPSPLTERMTLFWHNHFTSGQDKVQFPQQMAQQNRCCGETRSAISAICCMTWPKIRRCCSTSMARATARASRMKISRVK